MLDDRCTLIAIRNNGGRVNPVQLAMKLGVDDCEVFASLERLNAQGALVGFKDQSGMITA